jgi:hypothetical protein
MTDPRRIDAPSGGAAAGKEGRKVTRRFAILELRVLTLWVCLAFSCRRRSIACRKANRQLIFQVPSSSNAWAESSETLFWDPFRQAQFAGCGAWNARRSDVSVLTVMTEKESNWSVDVWLGCLSLVNDLGGGAASCRRSEGNREALGVPFSITRELHN